jgi:hypothetical protein
MTPFPLGMERIVGIAGEHVHELAREPGDLGELGEGADVIVDALVCAGLELVEAAQQGRSGRLSRHEGDYFGFSEI